MKPYKIEDKFLAPQARHAPRYDYEAPQGDPLDASNEPDAFSPLAMIQPGAEDVSGVDGPALDAWLEKWRAMPDTPPGRGRMGTYPEEAAERDGLRYHQGQMRLGMRPMVLPEGRNTVGPNEPEFSAPEISEDWDRAPYNEAEIFGSDPDADNDAMGDNDADGDGAYVDMSTFDHIPAYADRLVDEARAAQSQRRPPRRGV